MIKFRTNGKWGMLILLAIAVVFRLNVALPTVEAVPGDIYYSEVSAAILPPERSIDWQPGIPGGIPDYPVSLNVKDYGAVGNGSTNDTSAIQAALNAAPEGTAVLVPEGVYLINTLSIRSRVVLRGEGYQKTTLKLTGGNGVQFQGGGGSSWVDISGSRGSYSAQVSSTSGFSVGDFIVIRQDDDPALSMTVSGRNMGQVNIVKQISGNTLTFERPLYLNYKDSLNAQITPLNMTVWAGVEDLKLDRFSSAGAESAKNFYFRYAAYSWVRRVWSEKTYAGHVFFSRAYGNEVRESYFNDSYNHGSGGYGYGIRAESRSTDNLIEDNIFNFLRHAMLVQYGAAGNVFGYNYCRNSYTSQSPGWLTPDLSVHGNYPYLNLFEGNTVPIAKIDNVDGTNGPTTLFRNRMEKDVTDFDVPIDNPDSFGYIIIARNNPNHNLIGNELGTSGTSNTTTKQIDLDSSIASTIYESCNYAYETGSLWGGTDCDMPASYYLTSKPAFLGNLPWPLIGGDLAPNTNKIPAQQRYDDGTYIPSAGGPTPAPSSTPTPLPTATPAPTNSPTPAPPTLTPTPTPTPGDLEVYEAEETTLTDARVESNHPGYTGSGFVNYLANSGASVKWTNVDVPSSGNYTLTFRYALGNTDRPVEIKVNGSIVESSLNFPTTDGWSNWRTLDVTTSLNSGTNTIEAVTIGYDGPNFDHLVYPSEGSSVQTQIFLPYVSKSSLP